MENDANLHLFNRLILYFLCVILSASLGSCSACAIIYVYFTRYYISRYFILDIKREILFYDNEVLDRLKTLHSRISKSK